MTDDNTRQGLSRRHVLQTVGVTGALGLAGCTGSEGDDSSPATGGSGGSPNGNALRLGVTEPLSGPYASVGQNNRAAIEMTAKMWEEETGQPVELFVKDTKTDPNTGSRVARELIEQQDVHMLHGSYSSSVALAIGAVAQERKVPYVTTAGSTAYTGSKCKRYAFGCNPTVAATAYAIGKHALQNWGKKIYNITHNYTAGKTGYQAVKNRVAPEFGGEVVGNSLVDLGQTDMSSEISQAMNSGADILLTHVYAADLATLLKQGTNYGLYDKMQVGCSSIDLESTYPLGPEIVQNVWGTPQGWYTFDHPKFSKFANRVEKNLGRPAGMGAPNIFGGMWTALDVLNELDDPSNSKQVVKELEGREWSLKSYGKSRDGQYYRKCDHRASLPIPVAQGKSPDQAESQYDMLDIKRFVSAKESIRPCEQTGCTLPED